MKSVVVFRELPIKFDNVKMSLIKQMRNGNNSFITSPAFFVCFYCDCLSVWNSLPELLRGNLYIFEALVD